MSEQRGHNQALFLYKHSSGLNLKNITGKWIFKSTPLSTLVVFTLQSSRDPKYCKHWSVILEGTHSPVTEWSEGVELKKRASEERGYTFVYLFGILIWRRVSITQLLMPLWCCSGETSHLKFLSNLQHQRSIQSAHFGHPGLVSPTKYLTPWEIWFPLSGFRC